MEGIATPACGLVRDNRVFWNFFDYLFFNAEPVLAHSAEGAFEIVTDFFPLLALLVFVKDPAADFTNIFQLVIFPVLVLFQYFSGDGMNFIFILPTVCMEFNEILRDTVIHIVFDFQSLHLARLETCML